VNTFLARIGLGCGRLRAGAEESNSRRVLDAAVECGIRYFDTAPSYGSESVLGRGLRGIRREVQVCTKVGLPGSEPNSAGRVRALAITAMRGVLPDGALSWLKRVRRAPARTTAAPRGYGNFDAALIRSSVQESLAKLDTDRLDCLMLHEPRMSDPTPEVERVLRELVREGAAARLGVGTGYQLQDLPAFGDVAQFTVGPTLLASGDSRILIGHGLLRGFDSAAFGRCILDSGILSRIPALRRHASEPLEMSALLLSAVLIGTDIGRVLVSTSSAARLRAFISEARNIFEEIRSSGSADIRIEFSNALRCYFAVMQGERKYG
jgi:Aldo/keto reductase family